MTAFRDLTKALHSLGLTPNASTFYLESYRLGKTTIGKIAEKAHMDRSSAYLSYKQLRDAGLLDQEETTRSLIVWAKPPHAVITRLRAEARTFRGHIEQLESSISELLAGYAAAPDKPILQFFSGREGFAQIAEDVLESARGEILLLSNQREERRVFTDMDHREFIRARIKRGIRIRVLAPDTPEAHALRRTDTQSLRETRIIPSPIPFSSETYIYGDTVAMLSFSHEIVGFIVRSKDFAEAQRWMFEEQWRALTNTTSNTSVRRTIRRG